MIHSANFSDNLCIWQSPVCVRPATLLGHMALLGGHSSPRYEEVSAPALDSTPNYTTVLLSKSRFFCLQIDGNFMNSEEVGTIGGWSSYGGLPGGSASLGKFLLRAKEVVIRGVHWQREGAWRVCVCTCVFRGREWSMQVRKWVMRERVGRLGVCNTKQVLWVLMGTK